MCYCLARSSASHLARMALRSEKMTRKDKVARWQISMFPCLVQRWKLACDSVDMVPSPVLKAHVPVYMYVHALFWKRPYLCPSSVSV